MRTRFLPVWFLAVALMGVGLWQGNHDAARAATYYVTNKIDDGSAGTLRYEINQATDGDEVHIVTPGPIVLTGGQLNITKSITIKGPDILVDPTVDPTAVLPEVSGQVAIEGISPNGSVFSIANGKSVSMSHLFITGGTIAGPSHAAGNGDDGFGGGINNAGTLTLNYCTVAGNSAYGGDGPDGGGVAYGGGIFSSGTLTLNYSTVRDNLAQGGTGTNAGGALNAAYGGGIYSTGTTNINSSYIGGNSALGGGNASPAPVLATTNGGSAFGGGLAQQNSGTLNLTNTTVDGNVATSGTGSTVNGNARGGGVYVNAASLNPLQVTVANNTVNGAATSGAGVFYSGTAALDVNNSVFANNNGAANDLDAAPSFVPHNSPGINVAVGLPVSATHDTYSPTYALLSSDTTYVVDQGDNTLASSLSFDQRGYARKTGTRVDAGAVESASPTPTHTGVTPLPAYDAGFKFHVLNGATYFTAADFNSSLTYSDPNTSLKSIVITQVPPSSQGYFQLNGQTLVPGSVISVDDLDKLSYVSNDGNDSAELYWKASDGVSQVSQEFTSETPRWQAPSSNYVGGSNGNGANRPTLFLQTPVHVSGTQYTIGAQVNSSANNAGTYQVQISGYGNHLNTISPPTITQGSAISATPVITVTADPSTTNNYVVITATDINGNATTQSIVFSTNAAGDVDGVPYRDYGGSNGDGTSRPSLSVSNISQFDGITPNGDHVFYAAVYSNAHIGTGTTASVNVYVSGASATVSPGGNPTYTATGSASGTATITLHVTSGTHLVYVNATDINGGTTSYRFFYKGDASPEISSSITSGQHIAFGSTYTQPFNATDDDFYVPDTSISPEPLRYQVDQEGYAPSVSDPIDYNLKKGNIGSFGASNYTGNPGTTLTSSYYLETGIGKTLSKPGVYALRVSLTDYWGLGKTFVYTVIVDPPTAPIWTGPGTQNVQVNKPYTLNLNDYVTGLYPGSTPTYQVISGLPAWADFDPNTGIISSANATPTAPAVTVKVTVNDGLGNVIPNQFNIQVVNGAPEVTYPTEGSTIPVSVGTQLNLQVLATDPNGDTITYGASGLWGTATINSGSGLISTPGNLGPADLGPHPIVLTASDGVNTTTVHFTINVTNGNAPVIVNKSSIEGVIYNVQTGSNFPTGTSFPTTLTATDADGGDTLTFTATEGTFTNENPTAGNPGSPKTADYTLNNVPAGEHNITITVDDGNGNTDAVHFKVVGGSGSEPTLSLNPAGPSFSAVTGVPIPTITAQATDPDSNEDLTFSLIGAPTGMTLSSPSSFTGVNPPNSVSTTLQWTPTTAQASTYNFQVQVTDSNGFLKTVPVSINVATSAVNHPPNVQSIGILLGYKDVPFNHAIVATDPDGDNIVSYVPTGLPPGLFIDTNGVIKGTPTATGTYNVSVDVTDDSPLGPMTTTVPFQIVISNVNPPILNRTGGFAFNSPYTVAPGATFSKQLQAHDADYPETLTFSASYTDDNGATTVPLTNVWSLFNQSGNAASGTTASSTFTWNNVPAGVHVVTVTVKDNGGNSDTETFTVQSGNAPTLTISPTGTINVLLGSSMPDITAKAKDADSNENLSFTLENAPTGMFISPPSSFTGVAANTETLPVTIKWTPTASQAGTYTFNVVVSDKDGLSTKQPVTVTVMQPGVPSLSSVSGPITLHVGDQYTNTFTAIDSDAGDTLTFNAQTSKFNTPPPTWDPFSAAPLVNQTYENGPPTKATGLLVWNATQVGNYRVDVTVTDSQGHQAVQTFYINVVNSPPVVTNTPADQTMSYGTALNMTIAATDADADPLVWNSVQKPTWMTVTDNGDGTVTLGGTPTISDVGTSTVNLTVDDGVNPPVAVSFQVTVSSVGVPILSSAKDLSQPVTLHVNESFTDLFTSQDSDSDDTQTFDVKTYQNNSLVTVTPAPTMQDQSYDGGPPTKATSLLTWQSDTAGHYQVKVTVTDGQTHTITKTFFVNVVADNAAPLVSNPGTWIASSGTISTISIFASDPDSDPLTYTPSANMPSWVTLTPGPAGVILSGTPGPGDVGTTFVTVNVSDGVNTIPVSFTIQVVGSGVPTLQATPFTLANPEQVRQGDPYSRIFVSSDSDYPENLTFSVKVTDSGGAVLMDELSTDANTHIQRIYQSGGTNQGVVAGARFNWTPSAAGTYDVVVSVKDSQAHVTSLNFSIHVSSPPTITINPSTFNATPDLPMTIPVIVSDPDDYDTLTVTVGFNSPSNMTFDGPSTFSVVANSPKTATLKYTPQAFEANSHYTFDVTVTDSAGYTATQTVVVNVGAVNERPVIVSPTSGSTMNVVDTHLVSLPVIATDAEGDALTYSATGLPSGLSIDANTGIIGGTVSGSGNYSVTVNVDDGKHISPASSVTFTIAVGNTNHAPTLDPIADQSVIAGGTVDVQANGNDQDNDALTYTMTGNPGWLSIDAATGEITGSPAVEGSWVITVTANDGYTGTASQSFTLTVTGPFGVTVSNGAGYETITYTVSNITANTISPIVRGSLTGGGFTDNENAFFNASQGFVDDQWASPVIQRKLDPTKNTRILTWTVGDLAPGASATLTISVPIKGSTPHGTPLTDMWTVDYGVTHYTTPIVTHP